MKLSYPRDIFGQRTGIWDDHSSVNWVGWDVYWSHVAGQRLNMGGSSAYIDHADAVGSTTMETDPAGGVQWDMTHYPWGQVWQQGGTRGSGVYAGLDWQVNDPLIPSATRELSAALGRWVTPDPLGGDVTNPQSLNRYAYALNNPTTLNDPSGLQSGPPVGLLKAEFRFHCLMNPVCSHWMSVGGHDYWTIMGYDPFDVMQIPVVSSEWVPTQLTQNGNYLYMTTGHWENTSLGNALGLFGGGSSVAWWGTFAKSFAKNFSLKGARLPGETLSQCVNRVQDAVFTPTGTKLLAAFSLGSVIPAWGTTSVGTASKAVNLGGNLWTWEKVPAAPILESTPAWASTAIGVPTAVAWGLELGSLAACHP